MKQKERSKLKKKLKIAFSLRIRLRDGKCLKCGKTTALQCSHILSVGAYPNMQFDLENAITLCAYDHLRFWHSSPLDASRWFEAHFPGRYDKLRLKAQSGAKLDLPSLWEQLKI